MALISAGDQALLRGKSHSEYFLSPWIPATLWTARLNNGSIAREDQTIAFDTGAGSDFTAVEEHQTLWVGSAAGLHDIGKLRIKSITSGDGGVTGTVVVSMNGVDWSDDDYLTFLHDYEVWPVKNFTDANEVYYKDWEVDGGIAYTDENLVARPYVIGGPHVQVKFLAAGTCRFTIPIGYSNRIDTAHFLASPPTISVYPSAGVTVNAYVFPNITIDITAAGYYVAKMTATNNVTGETQVSYRKLIVHEDDPSSADYPFVDMSKITVSGSMASGGWKAVVRCNRNADISTIPDGTAALLWRRTYYGSTQKTITVPFPYLFGEDNGTVVNGFIRKDTITADEGDATLPKGAVSFEIQTLNHVLTSKPMFSIPLSVDNPVVEWSDYPDGLLDPSHVIYYLYRWHSTVLHTHDILGFFNIDIQSPDDGHVEAMDFQGKGTLFQMARDYLAKRSMFANHGCNKQGQLHILRHTSMGSAAARAAFTEMFTVGETDTSGPVTFIHAPEPRVPFVFFSGVVYDGTTTTPIGSTSPGTLMGDFGGKPMDVSNNMFYGGAVAGAPAIATAQAICNQKCGQYYAMLNNEWPEIRAKMVGEYLNVLEPLSLPPFEMDVASGDTPKGFVWTDQRMYVRSVSAKINLPSGTTSIDAIFEPEVDGIDGVPYQFPSAAPTPGGGDPPPPASTPPGYAILTAASVNYLPGGSSTWTQRIADAMNDVAQDPYWRVATKQDSEDPADAILLSAEAGKIRRSVNCGVSWSTLSPGNPPNDASDAPAPVLANLDFTEVHGSLVEDGEFVWLARWQNATNDWRSWLLFTDDNGATFAWRAMAGVDYLSGTATDVEADNGQVVSYGASAVPSVALTSTKTIVLRRSSADTSFTAFLLTLAASPATTVTVEDSVALTDGSYPCHLNPAIVRVSDTEAIVFGPYFTGTPANDRIVAYLLTVSGGNTLAITDTDVTAAGAEYSAYSLNTSGAARMSATAARFVYLTNTDLDINSVRATLSGSTITIGTSDTVVAYSVGVTEPHFPSLCALTGTQCVMLYHELISQRWHALLFTDSGFSVDSDIVIDTVDGPATISEASHNGRDKIYRIDDDRAVVVYPRSSGEKRVLVVTKVGSTLIAGTPLQLTVANPTNAGIVVMSQYRAIVQFVNTSNQLRVVELAISGTTVTEGSDALVATSVSFTINGSSIIDNLDGRYTLMYSANGVHGWLFVGGEDSSFDVKGAGIAVGKGDGDKLYATAWVNNILEIKQYSLPFGDVNSYSLGGATLTQFDDREFWAHPFTVDGDDDVLAIYGRMSNPGGLGNVHMVWSADAAWSVIPAESGFGANHVGSVVSDYYGNIYAVANVIGASPKIYATLPGLGLSLLSTAPVNGGVNPKAVSANWTGNVILGVDNGQAILVVYTPSPYIAWNDITGNHGIGSGINSIEVL